MTQLYTIERDAPAPVTGRYYVDGDGVQHPLRAISQAWSDEQLATIGLYRARRETAPEGVIVERRELVFEGGEVISRPIWRELSIEELRATARQRIEASYTATLSAVEQAYPAQEREGWSEQLRGAEMVKAGGSSPLIEAMTAQTGETAQECAAAILAKRAQYVALYGAATGRKRALMAKIAEAETAEEIAVVVRADEGAEGE